MEREVAVPGLDEDTVRKASACNNAVLRQASRRLTQIYDDALAPSGLRATQHALLANVWKLGTPTMGELANTIVMDLSALGHTLKPLERDGFVAVLRDEKDRRARRITLTDKGNAKLRETLELWKGVQDLFEEAFGRDRAAELRSVLRFLSSQEFQERMTRP